MKKLALFIILGICVFFASHALYAQEKTKDLRWGGCGILKKAFVTAMAKAYEEKTGVHIEVTGGGATFGIRSVKSGERDIGGSCRHLITGAPEEKGVILTTIGWDGIVVITNPANPVKAMSGEDIKKIFTGKITNWSELGGKDAPINLVVREGKISGVGRMTRELLFKDPETNYAEHAKIVKSSGPLEKIVETDENAVGVTGISSARKRNVTFIGVDGVEPTYENIANGKYPLFRPLYLTSMPNSSKAVKSFIRYAKSPEGQKVVLREKTVTTAHGLSLWPKYNKMMKEAKQEGNF